jgi:hypothetical protein
MDDSVRQLVRTRAGDRCEYCHLSQAEGYSMRFHIEHIRPRQHGGGDEVENLALACANCNWNKGPNLTSIDPLSDKVAVLFNPRTCIWSDHFAFVGHQIEGLTPTGRASVKLLRMNSSDRVQIRREVALRDVWNADA